MTIAHSDTNGAGHQIEAEPDEGNWGTPFILGLIVNFIFLAGFIIGVAVMMAVGL